MIQLINNVKPISEDLANEYLDLLFDIRLLRKDVRAEIHNAILYVCANLNTDFTKTFDDTMIYIVSRDIEGYTYHSLQMLNPDIDTVTDFIILKANEILAYENKTYSNFEMFQLMKKVEKLERIVSGLSSRNAVYGGF